MRGPQAHGLVGDLGQGAAVGAHQQQAELIGERLALLGRGTPPRTPHRQARHLVKIDARQDALVDQLLQLVEIAAAQRLVAADRVEYFTRQAHYQLVRRRIGGRFSRQRRQRRGGRRAAAPWPTQGPGCVGMESFSWLLPRVRMALEAPGYQRFAGAAAGGLSGSSSSSGGGALPSSMRERRRCR